MRFEKCMRIKYKKINIITGKVPDYIDTTFDFIVHGKLYITIGNFERSMLSECGV